MNSLSYRSGNIVCPVTLLLGFDITASVLARPLAQQNIPVMGSRQMWAGFISLGKPNEQGRVDLRKGRDSQWRWVGLVYVD